METVATILATSDLDTPFKVVFSRKGTTIVEHPVNSRLSGEELIQAILPMLQGFDVS